ncbi:MAG: hypothetical protein WAX77_09670 [Methylococcaceae bacterium]
MYTTPEIVIGFHGCDRDIADKVIKQGGDLVKSENSYDWLGHGVYFWEGSYERALEWAEQHNSIKEPAVIGAFIKLGYCIDLLDSKYLKMVKATYEMLSKEYDKIGEELPKNKKFSDGVSFIRDLDCKVILRLQQFNNEQIMNELNLSSFNPQNRKKIQNHPNFIDSVRGMFPEGKELYEGAGFREKNHIQLCVINPNSIIGYFEPRKKDSTYKNHFDISY